MNVRNCFFLVVCLVVFAPGQVVVAQNSTFPLDIDLSGYADGQCDGSLFTTVWGGTQFVGADGTRCEGDGNHPGVDIAALGTVRAVADGTPVRVERVDRTCLGRYVVIRHDLPAGPHFSIYAHLATIEPGLEFKPGVFSGDLIGEVGNTGACSTGFHLHFQIDRVPRTPSPHRPWWCAPVDDSQVPCINTNTISPLLALADQDNDGVSFMGGDCDDADPTTTDCATKGIIFSNFGPGDAYDEFFTLGTSFNEHPTIPNRDIAINFTTPNEIFRFDGLVVAPALFFGSNALDLFLAEDDGGQPGRVIDLFHIEGAIAPVFPPPPSLPLAFFVHPVLDPNTQYWVVASASGPLPSLVGFFVNSTGDAAGLVLVRNRPSDPWVCSMFFCDDPRFAIRVIGTPVN